MFKYDEKTICVEDAVQYADPLWNFVVSSLLSELFGKLLMIWLYADRKTRLKWLFIWLRFNVTIVAHLMKMSWDYS